MPIAKSLKPGGRRPNGKAKARDDTSQNVYKRDGPQALCSDAGARFSERLPPISAELRSSLRDPLLRLVAGYLSRVGYSTPEICRLLGVQAATASKLQEVSTAIRGAMIALAPEALQSWRKAMWIASRRGFHQPSMDLMLASGIIEPIPRQAPAAAGHGITVQVGIALPGVVHVEPSPSVITIGPGSETSGNAQYSEGSKVT